jgi:hypothetical protein
VLHAKDDPVCLDLAVPYRLIESNSNIVMIRSSNGGHLGWLEANGGRWSNRMIHSFLKKFIDENDHTKPSPPADQLPLTTGSKTVKRPVFKPAQRKMIWPIDTLKTSLENQQ